MFLRMTAWLLAAGLVTTLLLVRDDSHHTLAPATPTFKVKAVRVEPPAETGLNAPQRLILEGENLSPPPRAWLVPEIAPRRAILSTLQTWGNPQQILFRPPYAYVANGDAGIQILDIHDPLHPAIISSADTSGQALRILLIGPYLYVADSMAGLSIFNVSNPAKPAPINQVKLPGPALSLERVGEHLYLACGNAGVAVLDIATPAAPRLKMVIPLHSFVRSLSIHGQTILACLTGERIALLHRQGGGDVHQVNYLPLGQLPVCVAWCGDLAIIGHKSVDSRRHAFSVYDFSRPNHPLLLNTYDLPAVPDTISVSGTTAVVAYGSEGFELIDLGNPRHPQRLYTANLIDRIRYGVLSGPYLWLVRSHGQIYCLDPARLDQSLYRHFYSPTATELPRSIIASRSTLIISEDEIITIYNIESPPSFSRIASLTPAGRNCHIYLAENLLFALSDPSPETQGKTVLEIFDLSDPRSPRKLSRLDFDDFPSALTADRNRLFLSFKSTPTQPFSPAAQRLYGIDISQPSAPRIIFTLHTAEDVTSLALRANLLYTYSQNDFSIYDLSRLATPTRLGMLTTPWIYRRFANNTRTTVLLFHDFAYVATPFGGVDIIDIRNPRDPQNLANFAEHEVILDMASDQDLLYLSTRYSGLQVFDLTTPRRPLLLGRFDANFSPKLLSAASSLLSPRPNILIKQPLALSALPRGKNRLEIPLPGGGLKEYGRLWLERNGERLEIFLPEATEAEMVTTEEDRPSI